MKLQLLNGIFFSEHDLDIDHDSILQEVIDSRNNPQPSLHKSRPNQSEIDSFHTFYEDTNLYDKTYSTLKNSIDKLITSIFGGPMLIPTEIWGHIIPPMEQTMVHNHRDGLIDPPGLSWAYYPHAPENAGGLTFITNVNGFTYNVSTTPKKGKLLLFSNSILHYTPRNNSKIDRISISGNLKLTPELKDQLKNDLEYKNPYWYYAGRY